MKRHRTRSDHTLLIVILAIFVFNSPFTTWWTQQALPWYTIFLLWLGLIALVGWHQITGENSEEPASNNKRHNQRAEQKRGP